MLQAAYKRHEGTTIAMKGLSKTQITYKFINYHCIPYVETRSTRKKYEQSDRGKEVGRLKSRRYRERKSGLVDIDTLNREGGL